MSGAVQTGAIRSLRGQCACGAVAFEVDDAFEYACNCHCTDCRRKTGAAFKPFAGIALAKFRITHGANETRRFGGTDHDGHCARCGAFLYSVVKDATYVHVNLGTLSDTPSILPSCHIFVASKADWYEIRDELPRFAGHVREEN